MLAPFQRLLYCSQQGSNPLNVLLAASGPIIYLFNATDGTFISKWSHIEATERTKEGRDRSPGSHYEVDPDMPQVKRRKPSNNENPSDTPSIEVVIEGGTKRRRKPKAKNLQVPSVVILTATSDGKHVIAVTGEDKSLRVLELQGNGTLQQLSQRVMPKRPSAVTVTQGQHTILCADKFGDVYAIPLLWEPSDETPESETTGAQATPSSKYRAQKPFTPSATTSTVHTKKNLLALQNQQRLALNPPITKPSKALSRTQPLNFPHQLLLGHVSLLTDLVAVTLTSPPNSDSHPDFGSSVPNPTSDTSPFRFTGTRSYIITSDRDEHIRVSRGMPQAHIIENYCLAHSQFVSRLHVPAWNPTILISGGGNDYLLVWDWLRSSTYQAVDLRPEVEKVRKGIFAGIDDGGELAKLEGARTGPIAVSGIWSVETDKSSKIGEVIVAVEAVPALVMYQLDHKGRLHHRATLVTAGNVLDVSVCAETKRVFYAMDNVHQACTTNVAVAERAGSTEVSPWIGCYRWTPESPHWVVDPEAGAVVGKMNDFAKEGEDTLASGMDGAALSDLLYGIEHMRKRGGWEDAVAA